MLPGDFSSEKKARQRFLQREHDLREVGLVSFNEQILVGRVGARVAIHRAGERKGDVYHFKADLDKNKDAKLIDKVVKEFGGTKIFPSIKLLPDGLHIKVLASSELEAVRLVDKVFKSVGVTGR